MKTKDADRLVAAMTKPESDNLVKAMGLLPKNTIIVLSDPAKPMETDHLLRLMNERPPKDLADAMESARKGFDDLRDVKLDLKSLVEFEKGKPTVLKNGPDSAVNFERDEIWRDNDRHWRKHRPLFDALVLWIFKRVVSRYVHSLAGTMVMRCQLQGEQVRNLLSTSNRRLFPRDSYRTNHTQLFQ